ncbi:hypothetical protein F4680DRAFT_368376 [Xylaria scruposa]|nr:hypothetical protein F4680DRAFT_368376 [Xylaria scruposa]
MFSTSCMTLFLFGILRLTSRTKSSGSPIMKVPQALDDHGRHRDPAYLHGFVIRTNRGKQHGHTSEKPETITCNKCCCQK